MIVFEKIDRVGQFRIPLQKDWEEVLILDVMMAMGMMNELRAQGNHTRLKRPKRLGIVEGEKLLAPLGQCRRGFQQPHVDFHPETRLAAHNIAVELRPERLDRLRYQGCKLPAFFDMIGIG